MITCFGGVGCHLTSYGLERPEEWKPQESSAQKALKPGWVWLPLKGLSQALGTHLWSLYRDILALTTEEGNRMEIVQRAQAPDPSKGNRKGMIISVSVWLLKSLPEMGITYTMSAPPSQVTIPNRGTSL